METPMGPPLVPGFSLRVQLFSPHAHGTNDKPIRCFRVVTSPEVTVREFCEEASRIHEISYKQPLVIKKVQDDQEFDVTQTQVIGDLFESRSIIRIIQASAHPSIRDSIPPDSALRFEPLSRKREREGSIGLNGSAHSSAWNPNKRQRLSENDPDEPLPSREMTPVGRRNRRSPDHNIIPDSQGSVVLGGERARDTSRHVRQKSLRISETPSPSPPPSLQALGHERNPQADVQGQKAGFPRQNNVDHSSPSREASTRAQPTNPARAKSASYHIQRSNDRGTSVSTAATSPLSIEPNRPIQIGTASSNKPKSTSPALSATSKRLRGRSHNEDSIYENMGSDDEGSAISRTKRTSLKSRSSPGSGLPGLEWAKEKLNTPPNGNGRKGSVTRDQHSTPGELPLTPNSREREERQRQSKAADEARKARLAAAQAGQQRQREAEEARHLEEIRIAEEARAKREEQERIAVEEFNKQEAKRRAVLEKAAKLRKEKEDKEQKDTEEEARIAKQKAEEEQREKERVAKERSEEMTRNARSKSASRDAQRIRHTTSQVTKQGLRKTPESSHKGSQKSSSPEEARQTKSLSPILPRGTPLGRPISSTSFIPSGRKSSLKSSLSSQVVKGSSPAASTEPASSAVASENEAPQPNKLSRKVSFDISSTSKVETPVRPPTRILPPVRGLTPRASTTKPTPQRPTPKSITPVLPPTRVSSTPIPVPKTVQRTSLERNSTPTTVAKSAPTQRKPTVSKENFTPASTQPKRDNLVPGKLIGRPASPAENPTNQESKDENQKESTLKDSSQATPRPKKTSSMKKIVPRSQKAHKTADEVEEDDEESSEHEDVDSENGEASNIGEAEVDEDETQSQNSSTRDSRSPVVVVQHSKVHDDDAKLGAPLLPSESDAGSVLDSAEESEDDDESDKENTPKPKGNSRNREEIEASESGSESVELSSEEELELPKHRVHIPKSSPPILHARKQSMERGSTTGTRPNHVNSKDSFSDEDDYQDEIDQQLTSSMIEARTHSIPSSNPFPIPSSSIAPRPAFKVGASLSSLNQTKPLFGSSSTGKVNATRPGQHQLHLQDEESEGSEEESEEDSEEEGSDSSEDPKVNSKADKKGFESTIGQPNLPQKRKAAVLEEDSISESESDSDDDGNEDLGQKARNELLAHIDSVNTGGSQPSLPSPKVYKSSTQDVQSAKKIGGKKNDKYLFGYHFKSIGGSLLTELIDRNNIIFANAHTISALVRNPYQASILKDAGVEPLPFKDLDDTDTIRAAAKEHDIVIAAASARHLGCAKACLEGLGERQKSTGRAVHYIHVSGASMVGDWPVTGERIDTKTYSDIDDNIYEIERDFPDSYSPVRKVDLLVVEEGEKENVKTYIIPPPLIFGPGTGLFTTGIGQVHMLMQLSLKKKQSVMIGEGSGIWNRVHILDLSNLFALLVHAILEGHPDLPSGKTGYYFAENGFQTWKSISEVIGSIGAQLGAFETDDVGDISLQEAADVFYNGDLRDAEGVLASNSRTKADRARSVLGWAPKYGEESFLEEVNEVVASMIEENV